MSDYMIVEATEAKALIIKVKLLISDGWQCQGGIAMLAYPEIYRDPHDGKMSLSHFNFHHAQAMVKL